MGAAIKYLEVKEAGELVVDLLQDAQALGHVLRIDSGLDADVENPKGHKVDSLRLHVERLFLGRGRALTKIVLALYPVRLEEDVLDAALVGEPVIRLLDGFGLDDELVVGDDLWEARVGHLEHLALGDVGRGAAARIGDIVPDKDALGGFVGLGLTQDGAGNVEAVLQHVICLKNILVKFLPLGEIGVLLCLGLVFPFHLLKSRNALEIGVGPSQIADLCEAVHLAHFCDALKDGPRR